MKVSEFFRIVFGWIFLLIACCIPVAVEGVVRYYADCWTFNNNPPMGLIFSTIGFVVLFVIAALNLLVE